MGSRGLAPGLHLREDGRLLQTEADPERDDDQDQRQQEGNTPAPGVECPFARYNRVPTTTSKRTAAGNRRGRLQVAGVISAPRVGHVLGDVGDRPRRTHPQREALNQAQDERIMAAESPICAYVGITPIRAVERPIPVSVTRKVYFRPMTSPIRPKTNPKRPDQKADRKECDSRQKRGDGIGF